MTKWWRKYWKEKGHIRKKECNELLGIDSFYIYEKKKSWAIKRETHFAFNNYDLEKSDCKINVIANDNEFSFSMIEDSLKGSRRTEGYLEEDELHVLVTMSFQSPNENEAVYSKEEQSYVIHLETQDCNGCTFFRCPGKECGLRMRKLYYENGSFLCRKCLKLGYRSQRTNPFDRAKFSYPSLQRRF